MITHILAAIAFGFLLISISYRHALLLKKAAKSTAFFISLLFAVFVAGMSYLALIFTAAIKDTMFFMPAIATIIILLVLSFKAYFNTRRSKLADALFDIKTPKIVIPFAFATSFEAFLAYSGTGFLQPDKWIALAISGGTAFIFMWFGFVAGNRPNAIKNIRVFIHFASIVYILAALSTLLYIFIFEA
mgnify:FL=1